MQQKKLTAKEIEEAIKKYSQVLELKPNCVPDLIALADIYEEKQELNKAIIYRERAVKLMPKNANARARLAKLMLAVGKNKEAVSYYQEAIALNPQQPAGVYHQLGDGLTNLGKLEEAITAYQTALKNKPVNPNIIKQKLTDVQAKLIRKNEPKPVEKKPQSAVEKGKLAHGLIQQGNINEAIKEYEEALSLPGDKPVWLYQQLGDAYQKNNQLEKAIAVYQQVIPIYPKLTVAYVGLANAQAICGDVEAAISSLELGIKSNPVTTQWIYERLRTILKEQGKLEEAIARYRSQIEQNPTHPGLYVQLGDVLGELGEFAEAVVNYQKAKELGLEEP